MKKDTYTQYMRLAIKEARKNLKGLSGGPFGACIVKDGRVIAVARNTVLKDLDPTCHAEINAIRMAARKLRSFDLSGSVIYSTTEPCPMCFSAIHWARIGTVYFGTRIKDAKNAGFNELSIGTRTLKKTGRSPIRIVPDLLKDECMGLLAEWNCLPRKKTY